MLIIYTTHLVQISSIVPLIVICWWRNQSEVPCCIQLSCLLSILEPMFAIISHSVAPRKVGILLAWASAGEKLSSWWGDVSAEERGHIARGHSGHSSPWKPKRQFIGLSSLPHHSTREWTTIKGSMECPDLGKSLGLSFSLPSESSQSTLLLTFFINSLDFPQRNFLSFSNAI